MQREREFATPSVCLVCDALFLTVPGVIPPLAGTASGTVGGKAVGRSFRYEDLLEEVQAAHFSRGWEEYLASASFTSVTAEIQVQTPTAVGTRAKGTAQGKAFHRGQRKSKPEAEAGVGSPVAVTIVRMLPCPTCNQLLQSSASAANADCGTGTADPVATTLLSPAAFVQWAPGELPAMYVDSSEGGSGSRWPKWTLVQGLGPRALELDRGALLQAAGGGRRCAPLLYKPSFAQLLYRPRCTALTLDLTEERSEYEPGPISGKQGQRGVRQKPQKQQNNSLPATWTESHMRSVHQALSSFWSRAAVCAICAARCRDRSKNVMQGEGGGAQEAGVECVDHAYYWDDDGDDAEELGVIWLSEVDYCACFSACYGPSDMMGPRAPLWTNAGLEAALAVLERASCGRFRRDDKP